MCGRTCLTLEPHEITCACEYTKPTVQNENGKAAHDDEKVQTATEYLSPEWRAEFNCGRMYTPSHNIAPTEITPVLVSAAHFTDDDGAEKRLLVPMMWGMIPFWHKGNYRKHGLSTNNCRLEHMLGSKLFRGPFRAGQRCVVLCEGMYEWQTTKSAKPSQRAAYMIYMKQRDEKIKIYDRDTWRPDNVKLLKMAGLFDVWGDDRGDKIYSYSIITFESSKELSWLHHRMPAILETDQQVNDWLDFKHVSNEKALAALKPATDIQWHRVSNIVNNSRNKSAQCNKPIDQLTKTSKIIVTPQNKIMLSWLKARRRREQKTTKAVDSDESSSTVDDSENSSELDSDDEDYDGKSGGRKTTKRVHHKQKWMERFGRAKQEKAPVEQSTSTDSESEELSSDSDESFGPKPSKELKRLRNE